MCETKVMKLMQKASFLRIHGDDDFKIIDCYQICGFKLEIGVDPSSGRGYGSLVWEAALGLCQYFEKEGIRFSDKKVIELGAGTGIVSILVALLGGDVTITDKPELLSGIERNVSFNIPSSFKPQVKVRALRWGLDINQFPSDYDYILCSDIMYIHDSIPLILETLLHLSNEKTTIYFASTLSYGKNVTRLGHVTLSQYFQTELVCRYGFKDINVYRMCLNTPTTLQLHI
ncbi:EEF1A lysine methyltransferase 3-like isoform X1 [Scyliorhinus canicula]|uniref:EEF1A lysine methyltransferase 3-like isoform X1 n=1 Tax=Scyliorhinus canicula TaxID=7830 RepID=UPI0018F5862E|nr:EEF1A lysine methyltransferase 3-like isoform X1 [Scyliorhinus canicula]XP_038672789.1 EEF1A lysine methyltransferase 3-like isoform X1 [Scyliorhinus canicula]XP_038672790.1 EEF1A lysine methyltransferase 3-like isoform X1 [Scyliorhinus canicula]XP_038672791.1 EEF1A lysine methyltransferase 3-like isoform X1 [Scyliorhinus canicula]